MTYFAHSENQHGKRHPLSEHLTCVGRMAEEFAGDARWSAEARLAGLLHDLGKYGDLFQRRLEGKESGLDHWSAGAWAAASDGNFPSLAAALAIEGHHIGLCAGMAGALCTRLKEATVRHPLGLRLSDSDFARLSQRAEADGLWFESPASRCIEKLEAHSWSSTMLDIRLLFSCLVDADFLDTEAHFNASSEGKIPRQRGPQLKDYINAAIVALDVHMDGSVRATNQASDKVRHVRTALWEAVTVAARKLPRVFTLTAPTGSGKTLAMLKFALEHVRRYGLLRIVLAVPYLSIIEQTARDYQAVFKGLPDHFVLEHHSLAGFGAERSRSDAEGTGRRGDEGRQRGLLAKNWDAPIILTTNVQLLESLFSNRPSACRKLHQLMESVILLDEAQSLPQELAVPTLAALSHLSARYRSSVVFATATQPAFDHLDEAVKKFAVFGWKPKEIVRGQADMFAALKRVKLEWPRSDERVNWTELADKLRCEEQVLCVVNLKRHAHELAEKLNGVDGLYHLSTNLCIDHRRKVLDQVRQCLNPSDRKPCRLVATQCIEAGVDVDFPAVYRALGPLEAIAQAAGRCNREGRMTEDGRVFIFEPAAPDTRMDAALQGGWRGQYPNFAYWQAAQITRSFGDIDINDPDAYRRYYRKLFDLAKPEVQNRELTERLKELDFPEVAKLYRLIDDDAIQVVVPWSEAHDNYRALREQAMRGIDSEWMREAQALSVAICRPRESHPIWSYLVPQSSGHAVAKVSRMNGLGVDPPLSLESMG